MDGKKSSKPWPVWLIVLVVFISVGVLVAIVVSIVLTLSGKVSSRPFALNCQQNEFLCPSFNVSQDPQIFDSKGSTQFGSSIAISLTGDSIIVGSTNGAVTFILGLNGVWKQETSLTPPSNFGSDIGFGYAVDIAPFGDVVAVSAPGEGDLESRGTVFIYRRNYANRIWDYESLIQPPSTEQGSSLFGVTLKFIRSSSEIVVGAYLNNGKIGAVFHFGFDEIKIVWVLFQKLVPEDLTTTLYYGSLLAASSCGSTIVACGTIGVNDSKNGKDGFIDLWTSISDKQPLRRTSSNVKPPNDTGKPLLIGSVCLNPDGTVLAMGCPYDSRGVVYLWTISPVNLSLTLLNQVLKPLNPESNSFGYNIAMCPTANVLFVGAPFANFSKGEVSVYEQDEEPFSWEFQTTIRKEEDQARFGFSLAVSDGTALVVASPFFNNLKGRIYIYNSSLIK